jgi:D-sedoheptulose 7-phosphate isomerase
MVEKIRLQFEKSIEVKKLTAEKLSKKTAEAAELLIKSYQNGGKMILCGNGGSAADAQHLAAEMVGRFEKDRRSLPALALTTDTSALTAIGNDYGFEEAFARQVESLVESKDVLVAISTSGNSVNVLRAVEEAKKKGAKTIGLTGRDGGKLAKIVDLALIVPSEETPRIQEAHITIGHIVCKLVEENL